MLAVVALYFLHCTLQVFGPAAVGIEVGYFEPIRDGT